MARSEKWSKAFDFGATTPPYDRWSDGVPVSSALYLRIFVPDPMASLIVVRK